MIKKGDRILVLDEEENEHLTFADDIMINTSHGIVNLKSAIGKNWGDTIETSHGNPVRILSPRFVDIFGWVQRGPQIITLKDAALITAYTGISPGDVVIEGGTGSGALTSFMANLVRPNGKLYTYDIREDFSKLARKNLIFAQVEEFVEQKLKNIYEGIDEKEVDAVVLDVPEPWQVLPHAENALKVGGCIAAYIPTVNQLEKFGLELAKYKFSRFFFVENIQREYQIKPNATRPKTKGLMHTGFMGFARRV